MANWDATFEAFPLGSTQPSQIDDAIRELKEELRLRLEKELAWDSASPAPSQQGWSKSGSARTYYQAADPTTRPDASTTLSAGDSGRLHVHNATYRLQVWTGTAWVDVQVGDQKLLTTSDPTFNDLTVTSINVVP